MSVQGGLIGGPTAAVEQHEDDTIRELHIVPHLPEAAPAAGQRLKLMLIASSGGHLNQLHVLKPWWERHDRVWVTFRKSDSISMLQQERVEWAFHPTTRNIPNAARNLALAFRLLRRYRPDLVVSCGAGVAFPFFVAARMLDVRRLYIEVFDRIDSPTLTGRLCYPISDLFLLQWPEQQRFYPRGQWIGNLL
jgi:UDP-N-acetylglucosamine:LPS N-acetylglucosamine transferase